MREGIPQTALSINMGPNTNVEDLQFSYNAMTPVIVSGAVQDPGTGQAQPFRISSSDDLILSTASALQTQSRIREIQFGPTTGLTLAQATNRARGRWFRHRRLRAPVPVPRSTTVRLRLGSAAAATSSISS